MSSEVDKSQQFLENWRAVNEGRNKNSTSLSTEKYTETLTLLKSAKVKREQKSINEYNALKRFDILSIGAVEKLIKKRKSEDDKIIYYVTDDDLFNKIHEVHVAQGHGGINKMMIHLKMRYANITASAVKLYISLCDECQRRRNKASSRAIVVKPIRSSDLNSRGQVDLIDMQSQPDGNHKWILNYQDHFTKFVHLRPLERKCASDVANTLLDIFLHNNGAPNILQSDNGREFVNKIIVELTKLWPNFKLVHGRPRHPQSQGSVEKSNDEVHKQLVSWMRDNNRTNWAQGLKFVQFQKNSSHHSRLGMSPCEAVYGQPATTGLTSSSLPAEILSLITTEDDLDAIINGEFHANDITVVADVHTNNYAGENAISSQPTSPSPDVQQEMPTDAMQDNIDAAVNIVSAICGICDASLFEAIVCTSCSSVVHAECADNGQCHLCCLQARRRVKRKAALESQDKHAKKMVHDSDANLPHLVVGDSVRIPIPRVDRGRADPANMIGVVTDVSHDKYRLGTSVGHLDKAFSRNQIEKCTRNILQKETVPERELSLRSAVAEESVGTGQGFIQCNCKKGCSARCTCKKNNVLCNSRCHSSLSCNNK